MKISTVLCLIFILSVISAAKEKEHNIKKRGSCREVRRSDGSLALLCRRRRPVGLFGPPVPGSPAFLKFDPNNPIDFYPSERLPEEPEYEDYYLEIPEDPRT